MAGALLNPVYGENIAKVKCARLRRRPLQLRVRGRGGRVHGGAFGGASLVDDAFEEATNGRVRKRACVRAFGVFQDFFFTLGLIERDVFRLFQFADFESTARPLVQEFDEFAVDFVDAAAPVTEVHGATSRRERPCCAAALRARMRSARAAAAASTDFAFSISETRAEPTTAASAKPPRTETWPGCEMPKPTAMGSCATLRARRNSAGRSAGSASFSPVTPVREMR